MRKEVAAMLFPKRVKWRKQQRGRMRGKALRGADILHGEFALQAVEPGWVTARQIEAARRAIVREMKRHGKVWIRIFPDKPYTHRPPETRMGKGKGPVEYYVAVVKPGRIIFEVSGLEDLAAQEALRQAAYKFSIKTKVISREGIGEAA
jgi:large subunit ribosomal protein L16